MLPDTFIPSEAGGWVSSPWGWAMPPKVSDILELLRTDGWVQVAQRGSHRQFVHPQKPGRVTVSGKPSRDLPHAIHRSILKQAGLNR